MHGATLICYNEHAFLVYKKTVKDVHVFFILAYTENILMYAPKDGFPINNRWYVA